jgi:hypothetical protein
MSLRVLVIGAALAAAATASVALADDGFRCAGHSLPQRPDGVAQKGLAATTIPATKGRLHALVVFADFGRQAAVPPVPAYADSLFDPTLPGSLSHFYDTMSFGQLQLEGTVLPTRYLADEAAAAYLSSGPDEDSGYGRFVHQVLRRVDGDIDFGQFDNDGPDGVPNSGDDDGSVDYIFGLLVVLPQASPTY